MRRTVIILISTEIDVSPAEIPAMYSIVCS